MKVLSLFDGMACGMIAMLGAGIEVDRYVAFEIDKYAIKTATYNFPMIEQQGDVFTADFTQYAGFDWLVGGSPCTYWSIAQTNGRETEASGMGWELFQQYVRALHEAKPKYFIYENNKSMSKAIRQSINETFGFEAVLINSALVSAQNRQRLYWVGKRNADGTYSKVNVEQPIDRGILLKDVLDGNTDREKARSVICSIGRTTTREYFKKQQGTMTFEPISPVKNGKSRCLTAGYANKGAKHILESNYSDNPHKQQWDSVAEPVDVLANGFEDKAKYIQYDLTGKNYNSQDQRAYYPDAKRGTLNASSTSSKTGVVEPVSVRCRGRNGVGKWEARSDNKNGVVTANTVGINIAEPVNVTGEGKAIELSVSQADGKTYRVHQVENGLITIKGKQYPIKLADGYYIIRKLTVRECMRLQTAPEWYEFPVSDAQAYKMLGNGWTVEVIVHLIKACLAGNVEEPEFGKQIKFF